MGFLLRPALAQDCGDPMPFDSTAEAIESLMADPSAAGSVQRGWAVFKRRDGDRTEVWTFTPEDHPAFPSVARRIGCRNADGSWGVRTNLLCQSTKTACDALLQEYLLLDEQIKDSIRKERGSGI
jgi:hypothetical protein